MDRFASFVIRQRMFLLVLVGLLTAWFGYQAAKIRMDTDVLNFLPNEDKDVRFFKETGQRFGTNHINMVALETADIFTYESLSALRAVTDAVARVRGVNQVISLTNLLDMRPDGEGSISVKYLIDPGGVPRDRQVLSDLRTRVLSDTMMVGNLVSADGRAALISVMVDEKADKEKVAREVKEATRKAVPGQKIYFGGFAMIMEYMSGLIAGDMGKLIPITVVVVLLMLYLGLGSVRGVVLPMSTVILATVWTLGTMRMFGMALSMLTSVIPVVIIAIGTASGIYLLSRYYETGSKGSGQESSRLALAKEGWPVAFSGVTMVVGFLSLMSAPLSIFKEFGIAAAIGSFWAMVLSLTFMPAWLGYLSYAQPRRSALVSPENAFVSKVLGGIGRWVAARKKAVAVVALLLCAGAIALIPLIPRNVNLMGYFPRGSEPQVSELLLEKYFGGSQLFMINFRAKDVREPAILEEMDVLEKRLRVIPDVNLPQSIADILKMLNRNLNNEPGLPDSMAKVNNLWFMLEGQPSVALFLEKSFGNGLVQARIGDIDSAVVSPAISRIRKMVEESVNADMVSVKLASQPDTFRRAFNEEHARHIALKVALDVKFHSGKDISQEVLVPEIVSLMGAAPVLEPALRERLVAEVAEYFRKGEANLRIDSEDTVRKTARAVGDLGDFSEDAIATALKEDLPASALQKDPDGLGLDAHALYVIARGWINKARHARAVAKITSLLGGTADGQGSARLMEDLGADLWAVNDTTCAVPSGTYTRITGETASDDQRVRFETQLTGWPPVSTKFDAQLAGTMIKAFSVAFLVILLLLVVQLRSLRAGLGAAAPMIFTVLMNLAAMSLMRIPLDNTTLMISSIAMGVGVMYAIHFVSRFNSECGHGVATDQAIETTAAFKGRAILINTLTVALGFGVLVFSVMAPQRQFGLFIALTMVLANIATFSILPALLAMRKRQEATRGGTGQKA